MFTFSVAKNTYLQDESHVNHLFNTKAYIGVKDPADFYLLKVMRGDKVEASLYLFQNDGDFFSPLKATFGGVEYTSDTAARYLLTHMRYWLDKQRYSSLKLVLPPVFLMGSQHLYTGFDHCIIDKNYHIPITDHPFERGLHPSALRRLKKCLKHYFSCSLWECPEMDTVYDFIDKARKRKGYPMTMQRVDFKKMFETLPANYLVFVVKQAEKIAALGVTVKLSSDVLYHFYPADAEDFLGFSPSIFLHKVMYEYCQEHGYSYLDLGIATDKGVDNQGLIRFKENLGATLSQKKTYILTNE